MTEELEIIDDSCGIHQKNPDTLIFSDGRELKINTFGILNTHLHSLELRENNKLKARVVDSPKRLFRKEISGYKSDEISQLEFSSYASLAVNYGERKKEELTGKGFNWQWSKYYSKLYAATKAASNVPEKLRNEEYKEF